VTTEEAKEILLPYRHGTSDADDPQVAEALALARQDQELARWLEAHCARQYVISEKLRRIAPPDGLIQQIIFENRSAQKQSVFERKPALTALVCVLAILVCLFVATDPTEWWRKFQGPDNRLVAYQHSMARVALSTYGMGLATSDTNQIRAYLKQNDAPSDFALNASLKQTHMTGCAVEDWHGAKVSMLCFHSNPANANAKASDLWLFVANRDLVSDLPDATHPQLHRVDSLLIATWVDGDRIYMLARQGDLENMKKFL
jgi:hypothetical protein